MQLNVLSIKSTRARLIEIFGGCLAVFSSPIKPEQILGVILRTKTGGWAITGKVCICDCFV